MKQPRRGLALPASVALVVVAWLCGGLAMAAEGLTTISSDFGPKETMDRLEAELKANGVTVFARIDHAAGAASVGLPLRPTELLIFGNAKAGTPLMQANQAIGIDLPLKRWCTKMQPARSGWPTAIPAGLPAGTGLEQPSRRTWLRWRPTSKRSR
jgi:hypothetical protein